MQNPDPITYIHRNFQTILNTVGRFSAPDKFEQCQAYTSCLTGLPHPLGNLVIAGEQTEIEFKSMLEKLEGWTMANQVPVAVGLFPTVGMPGRSEWMTERNWLLMDTMPGMWMDLPDGIAVAELDHGVEIRVVEDSVDLDRVCAVLAEGYPIPAEVSRFFMQGIQLAGEANGGVLANFLVSVDGEPAASSSVCIEDGVAGIYCVATLERFRRKGLGAAVTMAAMEYAQNNGARHALLHASAMGTPVYERIGFVERCRIPLYGFGLEMMNR